MENPRGRGWRLRTTRITVRQPVRADRSNKRRTSTLTDGAPADKLRWTSSSKIVGERVSGTVSPRSAFVGALAATRRSPVSAIRRLFPKGRIIINGSWPFLLARDELVRRSVVRG